MNKVENNPDLKYQYFLKTWGGFYNKEHQEIHGCKAGDFLFDTEVGRQSYIDKLKEFSNSLNAKMLMIEKSEGYHCNIPTVLHRVVEYKGKRYYDQSVIWANYPYHAAEYQLEWKWYPGNGTYPLGEDFDYEDNDVKIIQEWITGAFSNLNND